jgi:hypothetical protein
MEQSAVAVSVRSTQTLYERHNLVCDQAENAARSPLPEVHEGPHILPGEERHVMRR